MTLARRLVAEALDTAMLLAVVVGSGIMAAFAGVAATNTFAGIRPADTPGFILAQLAGAAAATALFGWLYRTPVSSNQ